MAANKEKSHTNYIVRLLRDIGLSQFAQISDFYSKTVKERNLR